MHLDLDRFGFDSSLKRSLPGEWHAAQKYAYVLVIRRHIWRRRARRRVFASQALTIIPRRLILAIHIIRGVVIICVIRRGKGDGKPFPGKDENKGPGIQ